MRIQSQLFSVIFLLIPIMSIAQFQWEHSGGPLGASGGELYSDGTTAFYTGQYFLYRTIDGQNWEEVYERYLAYFAFYGDTLVGHLKNYYDQDAPQDSIAISLDGGDTWTELPLPEDNIYLHEFVATKLGVFLDLGGTHYIWKLADDAQGWEKFPIPQYGAYQLFSAEGELYYSTLEEFIHVPDEGTFDTLGLTWDDFAPPYHMDFFAHDNFISIVEDALWPDDPITRWSFDGGQTWEVMDTSVFGAWVRFTTLDDKIYQLRPGNKVYVSADGAQSWTPVTPTTPVLGYRRSIAGAAGKLLTNNFGQVILAIDPESGTVIQANHNLAEAYTGDTDYSTGSLWAASGNGLFTYDLASQSWSQNSSLYRLGESNGYEFVDANENGIVLVAQGSRPEVFEISQDGGLSWTSHNFPWQGNGQNTALLKTAILDDILYISAIGRKTYRSADYGETWQEVLINDLSFNSAVLEWNDLHVVHTDDKIYTSADEGITWSLHADFTIGTLDRLLTVDNILFAFVRLTQYDPYQRAFVSDDGIHWRWAHDGLPPWMGFYFNPLSSHNLSIPTDFFSYGGNYYLHLGHSGIFATTDTFNVWFPLELIQFNNYELADSIFFKGYYGGLRKSHAPSIYGELVSGKVFFDRNDNGLQESEEQGLKNIHVSLIDPEAIYPYYGTMTEDQGIFKLGMNLDSEDTLRCNFTSRYLQHINPEHYLLTAGSEDNHFGIVLEPDKTDLSLRGNSGRYRPGFDTNIHLSYKNEGSTEPQSYLSFHMDSVLELINATPPPTSIVGDTMTWLLGQLPIASNGSIKLVVHVPSTVLPEAVIWSSATVSPSGQEETPGDNTTILSNLVFGSFDPNDKLVDPPKGLTIQDIKDGKEVFYTIRFQNTGNYLADRVKILDPIDTTIILNSVRIVSSSHEISSTRILPSSDRMLEIIFDNIFLPDSASDFAGSQGYVTFAAQRHKKFGLTVPTKNQAMIYFDFNAPIFTNTKSWYPQADIIINTEDYAVPLKTLTLKPNPASHYVTITSEEEIYGEVDINVITSDGKNVLKNKVSSFENEYILDISKLIPGLYTLELWTESQKYTGRLVVQ
ncbi:MAG TPA: T9SS type A sorting domain-containing protein [Saprospiraceae bacterium]|nr:T9SS type A sorting domain-containing protein [Saprospiraceae bacterium]